MKLFRCECGQRVFFENTSCIHCGRTLGFDVARQTMVSLSFTDTGSADSSGNLYRQCRNQTDYQVCNWLIPVADSSPLCAACRLNGTIPNLANPGNLERWQRLEQAKRRLLYGLVTLGLPIPTGELVFHFKEDQRSNPWVAEPHVLTGHAFGHITINVAEADPVMREASRVDFNEPYRTLLGHFRHESGHFYWGKLVKSYGALAAFRQLFDDERADYAAALTHYRDHGPVRNWHESFISAYASSHPHEDWAETWAHYLHIMDTLETAAESGVIPALPGDDWLAQWLELSVVLNELNRSMGVRDAYPFTLTETVVAKLEFTRQRVADWRRNSPATAAGAVDRKPGADSPPRPAG